MAGSAVRFFGHTSVRESLEQHLPQVTLLRGPRSVGKTRLADYLIQYHGFKPADVRKYDVKTNDYGQTLPALTADSARDIISFAGVAPFGKRKCVVANVDGATEASLNTMLKLLEEPPRTVCFILTANGPVLDTIASRSSTYRMGLLDRDEVFEVLTQCVGMSPAVADKAADLGRGQVDLAVRAGDQESSRALVLSVLKAVHDGDADLLANAAVQWDDSAHDLLRRWCYEAITGRWQLFNDTETFGLTKEPALPRRVLISLSATQARPKLAVRVQLASIVESRKR